MNKPSRKVQEGRIPFTRSVQKLLEMWRLGLALFSRRPPQLAPSQSPQIWKLLQRASNEYVPNFLLNAILCCGWAADVRLPTPVLPKYDTCYGDQGRERC